jgi:hypothetical protein
MQWCNQDLFLGGDYTFEKHVISENVWWERVE